MSHLPFGFTWDDAQHPASLVPTPIVFEPVRPQHWEYRVAVLDTREQPPLGEEQLASYGAEGWILVGVLSLAAGVAAGPSARLYYYFVRAA